MPEVGSAPASRGLLLRQKNATLRSTLCCRSHGRRVGRGHFIEVLKVTIEDRPTDKVPENFGQQQIGNGAQLIAGGRMAGDIDTQSTQLLNEPPYFGTAGRK